MNYKIISSCSTGNATIIRDIILIDCGVTFKKLEKYYKQLKIVLLTHVHQDHFNRSTIKRLAQERPTLRFACCEWLLQPLLECGVERRNIDILQIGKASFCDVMDRDGRIQCYVKVDEVGEDDYKLFKIVAIKLYHDVNQCGYRILFDDYKVIYMTDTKTIEGISAKNYDLYLVEANYKENELEERIKQKQLQGDFTYE